MNKSFGAQLQNERKKQGLTIEAIAQMCGTPVSNIELIENGGILPDKKILPKLANALNLKTLVVLNWYLEDLREKLK